MLNRRWLANKLSDELTHRILTNSWRHVRRSMSWNSKGLRHRRVGGGCTVIHLSQVRQVLRDNGKFSINLHEWFNHNESILVYYVHSPEGIYSSGMCSDEDRAGIRGWPSGRCCASWPLRCRPAERTVPELSATVSPVCDTWRGDFGTRPAWQKVDKDEMMRILSDACLYKRRLLHYSRTCSRRQCTLASFFFQVAT